MKYVEKVLQPNEHLKMEAKLHWLYLTPRIGVSFLLLILGMCFRETHVIIFMLLLDVYILARPLIIYFTTELSFTDRRVIGKIGLINTKTLDAPLHKINNAYVESGLIGKIFGYGDIVITTSSGAYRFRALANAEEFKNALISEIER